MRRFHQYGGMWLGLVTLVVFFRVTGFGFLTWDRELFSNRSPVPFGLFRAGVVTAFQVRGPWDGAYGPVAMVSHMVDFQVFGFKAFAHHLTSVWFHVLNTVLVFALVRELVRSARVAAMAAAIFALHPLQVAPVVWVSQRRILVATLFVLATILWWLRYRRTGLARDWCGALACCCLAVLSYPAGGAVGLAVPILEGTGRLRSHRFMLTEAGSRAPRFGSWPTLSRLAVMGVGGLGVAWSSLSATHQGMLSESAAPVSFLDAGGLVTARLVDTFSALALTPLRLAGLGGACPATSLEVSGVSGFGMAVALAGFVLAYAAWRWRVVLAGVFAGTVWFLGVGLAATFSEREGAFAPVQWTYLANVGSALAVASLVTLGLRRVPVRRFVAVCVLLALSGAAWATTREMGKWSASEVVANRVLGSGATGRQAWRAWHCLGVDQSDRANDGAAARCFRAALAHRFDSRTLFFMGLIERRHQRATHAALFFREMVRQNDLTAAGRTALGQMAQERGDMAEAAHHFCAALAADSRDIEALIGLAMIRAAAPQAGLRNGPEALRLAQRALALTANGHLHALSAAAAAHAELGEFQRAQVLAKVALFWTVRLADTNEVAFCEQRVESYKAHKPWRMPSLNTNQGSILEPGAAKASGGDPSRGSAAAAHGGAG